jgi:ABC-type transport system substrate-binding protein
MSDLVVALEGAPGRSLDPCQSSNLYNHAVIWPICEPLFDIGIHGSELVLVPRLAQAWHTTDGLKYTFHLRPNVFFHDKRACDATAVEKNLRYAVTVPSFRGRILSDLISVDGITARGGTLEVQLKYPKVALLYLALMVSPDTLGAPDPVGTGPFMKPKKNNGDVILEANTGYRGGRPQLKSLTFRILPSAAIPGEVLRGGVDFARIIEPVDLPLISNRLPTLTVRPFGTYYLGFNTTSKLFADPEVRRSIGAQIDPATIANEAGLAPAVGPIPRGVEGYDQDLPRVRATTDLRAVRDADAIPLLFNEHSWCTRILACGIRADLATSGITVKLEPVPGHIELVKATREKQSQPFLVISNWYSILPAAEIFLQPFLGDKPENLTGYTNANAVSRQAYREAQQRIVADAPAIFLGHPRVRVSAHSPRVRGLELNVQSFPVDRFLGVDVI